MRIREFKPNYMASDIGMIIAGYMKQKNISPKVMGEALGISRQGMNNKIKNNAFSYKDIIVCFHVLGLTQEQILKHTYYE